MVCQGKPDIVGSRPFSGIFVDFGVYVMGTGCHPMGFPMFRPLFVMYK
jgi:hypothetical protein